MGALLSFHPLALEDAATGDPRPKLDDYGDYIHLVFYGARGGNRVTLQQDRLPAIHDEQNRLHGRMLHNEQFLLYRGIDALADHVRGAVG